MLAESLRQKVASGRRRKEGLLWECMRCRKMRPRGWFARNGRGEGSRHAHCRECRREGKAADAARRRGAGVAKIPAGWVRRLLLEQRGLCAICGRWLGPKFHVDHKRAVSRGGRHEYNNLQLTHKICNLRKSNQ
jgi:5-methylcytosine-specific restriction endonuclease McrA